MLYAGIDYHKRYSQVHVIDEQGRTRVAARLANDFETMHRFFARVAEPCRAVVEAGWNWGVMYDWLDAIENVAEVELAHPYRVRAIAAAQVKTDSIDAHSLAQLLRVNLIRARTYRVPRRGGCASWCANGYCWCGCGRW